MKTLIEVPVVPFEDTPSFTRRGKRGNYARDFFQGFEIADKRKSYLVRGGPAGFSLYDVSPESSSKEVFFTHKYPGELSSNQAFTIRCSHLQGSTWEVSIAAALTSGMVQILSLFFKDSGHAGSVYESRAQIIKNGIRIQALAALSKSRIVIASTDGLQIWDMPSSKKGTESAAGKAKLMCTLEMPSSRFTRIMPFYQKSHGAAVDIKLFVAGFVSVHRGGSTSVILWEPSDAGVVASTVYQTSGFEESVDSILTPSEDGTRGALKIGSKVEILSIESKTIKNVGEYNLGSLVPQTSESSYWSMMLTKTSLWLLYSSASSDIPSRLFQVSLNAPGLGPREMLSLNQRIRFVQDTMSQYKSESDFTKALVRESGIPLSFLIRSVSALFGDVGAPMTAQRLEESIEEALTEGFTTQNTLIQSMTQTVVVDICLSRVWRAACGDTVGKEAIPLVCKFAGMSLCIPLSRKFELWDTNLIMDPTWVPQGAEASEGGGFWIRRRAREAAIRNMGIEDVMRSSKGMEHSIEGDWEEGMKLDTGEWEYLEELVDSLDGSKRLHPEGLNLHHVMRDRSMAFVHAAERMGEDLKFWCETHNKDVPKVALYTRMLAIAFRERTEYIGEFLAYNMTICCPEKRFFHPYIWPLVFRGRCYSMGVRLLYECLQVADDDEHGLWLKTLAWAVSPTLEHLGCPDISLVHGGDPRHILQSLASIEVEGTPLPLRLGLKVAHHAGRLGQLEERLMILEMLEEFYKHTHPGIMDPHFAEFCMDAGHLECNLALRAIPKIKDHRIGIQEVIKIWSYDASAIDKKLDIEILDNLQLADMISETLASFVLYAGLHNPISGPAVTFVCRHHASNPEFAAQVLYLSALRTLALQRPCRLPETTTSILLPVLHLLRDLASLPDDPSAFDIPEETRLLATKYKTPVKEASDIANIVLEALHQCDRILRPEHCAADYSQGTVYGRGMVLPMTYCGVPLSRVAVLDRRCMRHLMARMVCCQSLMETNASIIWQPLEGSPKEIVRALVIHGDLWTAGVFGEALLEAPALQIVVQEYVEHLVRQLETYDHASSTLEIMNKIEPFPPTTPTIPLPRNRHAYLRVNSWRKLIDFVSHWEERGDMKTATDMTRSIVKSVLQSNYFDNIPPFVHVWLCKAGYRLSDSCGIFPMIVESGRVRFAAEYLKHILERSHNTTVLPLRAITLLVSQLENGLDDKLGTIDDFDPSDMATWLSTEVANFYAKVAEDDKKAVMRSVRRPL